MSTLIGRKAPEFTAEGVLNGQFKSYKLADYAGKWVVLFFYPLDFTFVCPTEILAFSDRLAEFKKEIAASFQVLADGGAVALRGLFVIDPDGVVQHATINNLGVGRSVDETLRVLQAFQYVKEHGEVCPADWKPGKKTMKADWAKSKEYFSQAK